MFFSLVGKSDNVGKYEEDISLKKLPERNLTMFLGTHFSINEKLFFILKSVFGVSRWFAERVFCYFSLPVSVRLYMLSDAVLGMIESLIIYNDYLMYGRKLRNFIKGRLERYIVLRIYKGLRFIQRLPMRGQRSKTNSRTMKRNSFKVFYRFDIKRGN